MPKKTEIILYTVPNNMVEILGKGAQFVTPQEPLGLMYIAGYLEKFNKKVSITDAFSFNISEKDIIKEIREKKPDIVGFSVLTSGGTQMLKLGALIKEKFPEVLVVLGNIHASEFANIYLEKNAADIIVHDEGEVTFLEIVNEFESEKKWSTIKGISYKNTENKVVKTINRELLENLDEIPMPARHLVPIEKYRAQFYFHPYANTNKYKVIMTSRGCTFRCSFCSVHKSRKIRFHSLNRVKEELELLVKEYKSKFIFFMDSLFMASEKRVNEICDIIINNNFKFEWGCEGRVNLANFELLKKMRRAGCSIIAYGIESGDQQLLNNIKKDCTIKQINTAIRNTNKAKIRAMGLFILGLPGETPELSQKTIEFAKKLPLSLAQFAIFTPYPGSEIYYNLVLDKKIDIYDWDRFSQYINFTDKKPIWTPEGFKEGQLTKLNSDAVKKFYLRPKIIWGIIKQIRIYNVINYLKALNVFF